MWLTAYAELVADVTVAVDILLHQIGKHPLPLADQMQKRPSAGMIFLVGLEMVRKTVDSVGEQRYLTFNRAGILCRTSMGGENLGLFFLA